MVAKGVGPVSEKAVRYRLKVSGTVQGVGFRPFVFNLARAYRLGGKVYNDGEGVMIEVEGRAEAVAAFVRKLAGSPPPLARIDRVEKQVLPPVGERDFTIRQSRGQADGKALAPPDVALCPDCRRELANPADRHYRYPFTNCTNCGPRFTIIRALPYDRHRTAMNVFAMCPDCAREYHDPADRRFHAQPVACPACGPQVELVDRKGCPVATGADWPETAGALLQKGYILAVKGLGGFHLACAAANREAVLELRRRKNRPAKPFALMCRDLATVERHCSVAAEEAELLRSPAAPIVLLRKRPDSPLPPELAPGLDSLGVMLPYTPLHLLLLQAGPPVLVMTSGNKSDLPLVTDNRQALAELGEIADYFLLHNREIINRCDDSVTAVVDGETLFFRRSRGYVPQLLAVPAAPGAPAVLGIGGEMKNTFCLFGEGKAYLSQHIGEVDFLEGQENLEQSIENFCRLVGIKPQVVAADLHPGYRSARLAGELAARLGIRRHPGVQHHHAHLASCMAENGLDEEVIGIILDGTGYGVDGRLWGFEVLRGDYREFHREFHLAYVPLPGGERAVRNPWLTAAAYLITFLGERGREAVRRLFGDRGRELALAEKMLAGGLNSPPASSCGRFFDAVAALLGVCFENTYEGQAAATLGSLTPWFPSGPVEPASASAFPAAAPGSSGGVLAFPAATPAFSAGAPASSGNISSPSAGSPAPPAGTPFPPAHTLIFPGDTPSPSGAVSGFSLDLQPYPFAFQGPVIDPAPVFAQILADIDAGVPAPAIAKRFHDTVIAMVVEAACRVRERTGLSRVVLSGGTWQNRYLTGAAKYVLQNHGFTVYRHRQVPPGDGGLSLGQAMVAAKQMPG
ncbi:MAG: carbamoyltransferase HypF [Armatimonadetes bacterium]|nr:carbamoyltransferase HypF [Armatimonadota bacterium]